MTSDVAHVRPEADEAPTPQAGARVRTTRRRRRPWALWALAGGIMAFLYAPIAVLVLFSFNTSRVSVWPLQGFTLGWYVELVHSPEILAALRNSLLIGIPATAIAGVLGTLAGYAAHRFRFPGKTVLRRVVLLPMVVPGVVTGIALLSLFDVLGIRLSRVTVLLGHITFLIVVFFTSVYAALERLPVSLEKAAMDLGATPFGAFRKAVLPNLRLALIGGSLLAFAVSFDEILITFFLTGTESTLPMLIYSMLRLGVTPRINALATVLLVVTVTLVLVSEWLTLRAARTAERAMDA